MTPPDVGFTAPTLIAVAPPTSKRPVPFHTDDDATRAVGSTTL